MIQALLSLGLYGVCVLKSPKIFIYLFNIKLEFIPNKTSKFINVKLTIHKNVWNDNFLRSVNFVNTEITLILRYFQINSTLRRKIFERRPLFQFIDKHLYNMYSVFGAFVSHAQGKTSLWCIMIS